MCSTWDGHWEQHRGQQSVQRSNQCYIGTCQQNNRGRIKHLICSRHALKSNCLSRRFEASVAGMYTVLNQFMSLDSLLFTTNISYVEHFLNFMFPLAHRKLFLQYSYTFATWCISTVKDWTLARCCNVGHVEHILRQPIFNDSHHKTVMFEWVCGYQMFFLTSTSSD